MNIPRIYQSLDLNVGSTITLDTRATHHLLHVLRSKIGQPIKIFNGKVAGDFHGVISFIQKKRVEITLETFEPKNTESSLNIRLLQGVAKGEKMDFIIQKAVELGVKEIVPVVTEYTNVRLNKERELSRQNHWQGVLIHACEQSGRNKVPVLFPFISLPEILSASIDKPSFILTPTGSSLSQIHFADEQSIQILIGPEGGLSSREIQTAQEVGFKALQLGPRILRTETASLAAISILQALYGDMGKV